MALCKAGILPCRRALGRLGQKNLGESLLASWAEDRFCQKAAVALLPLAGDA